MIPYLEIRDPYTLKTVALVEPQECWLELSYQEVGEFEIFCLATKDNLNALKKGRFVKIPNKRFIWYITSIQYTFTAGGARMISAKGYEGKWLLNKRCILTPKELTGTITNAIYGLVNQALGTSASAMRKIERFAVDTNTLSIDIVNTLAPRVNLLEFTNALLTQYNCGSIVEFINGGLKYRIYQGNDKTNSVRFSQSLDNLLASEYYTDDSAVANYVLVVSTIDDIDYLNDTADRGYSGIDRAEIIIESNLSTKYEDANGVEQETTPDSDLYKSWQFQEGYKKLQELVTLEEMSAEIDLLNSIYEFDKDYFLGDIVTAKDEHFNYSLKPRILKYTFKQDANGYGEEAEYGG